MYNKQEYNPLAAALLEPFSASELRTNQQGFTYVDPERYRARLLKHFPKGYTFHVHDVQVGKTAVTGYGHFIGEVDGVKYDIDAFAMENYQLNANSKEPQKVDLTMQMLHSALLKSISREIGLGLHLYQKENGGGGIPHPAGNTSTQASAPVSAGNWDGNAIIGFGKHKGKQWSHPDVDAGYLNFVTKDPEKANQDALKEIARRSGTAIQTAQTNAANATMPPVEESDDSEIPF